jgi:glycyl-tRNA synthetase
MEKLTEKEKNEDKKKEYAAVVARIDDFSPAELEETMAKYRVLSPEGKPVSAPFPFNLMFAISIGPTGMYKGCALPHATRAVWGSQGVRCGAHTQRGVLTCALSHCAL